mgnify:CR=1 FL=1
MQLAKNNSAVLIIREEGFCEVTRILRPISGIGLLTSEGIIFTDL